MNPCAFDEDVTGHGRLLSLELLELLFDQGPVFLQLRRGLCFEAQHQRGLRVGGADQSPAVREAHANAVDIDVPMRLTLSVFEIVGMGLKEMSVFIVPLTFTMSVSVPPPRFIAMRPGLICRPIR